MTAPEDFLARAEEGLARLGKDGAAPESIHEDVAHAASPSALALVPVSSIRAEAVQWVWEDRIPIRSLTGVVGVPGLGKTTLLVELMARATRGQLDGDLRGTPIDVVFVTAEDSVANTIRPRLEAAGADLDRVHVPRIGGIGDGLVIPDGLPALGRALDALPDVRLVVVDPFAAHLNDRVDFHRDHSIRRALGPAAAFADERCIALVFVAHFNKMMVADLMSRIGGSVGLAAALRSALAFLAHPSDPNGSERVLVAVKANLSAYAPTLGFRVEARTVEADDGTPIATSGLVWKGESPEITRFNAVPEPERTRRTALSDAVTWLGDVLADGPMLATKVNAEAALVGITERTLRRAKDEIGVRAVKDGLTGPWWCSLPDGAAPIGQGVQDDGVGRLRAADNPSVQVSGEDGQTGEVGHLRRGLDGSATSEGGQVGRSGHLRPPPADSGAVVAEGGQLEVGGHLRAADGSDLEGRAPTDRAIQQVIATFGTIESVSIEGSP